MATLEQLAKVYAARIRLANNQTPDAIRRIAEEIESIHYEDGTPLGTIATKNLLDEIEKEVLGTGTGQVWIQKQADNKALLEVLDAIRLLTKKL